MWDYTNDIETGFYSKEEVGQKLKEGYDGVYSDCQIMDGILYKGEYCVKL